MCEDNVIVLTHEYSAFGTYTGSITFVTDECTVVDTLVVPVPCEFSEIDTTFQLIPSGPQQDDMYFSPSLVFLSPNWTPANGVNAHRNWFEDAVSGNPNILRARVSRACCNEAPIVTSGGATATEEALVVPGSPDPLYGFRVIQNGIDVILWSAMFNPSGGAYSSSTPQHHFGFIFIESVGGSTAAPTADVTIPLTIEMCGTTKTLNVILQGGPPPPPPPPDPDCDDCDIPWTLQSTANPSNREVELSIPCDLPDGCGELVSGTVSWGDASLTIFNPLMCDGNGFINITKEYTAFGTYTGSIQFNTTTCVINETLVVPVPCEFDADNLNLQLINYVSGDEVYFQPGIDFLSPSWTPAAGTVAHSNWGVFPLPPPDGTPSILRARIPRACCNEAPLVTLNGLVATEEALVVPGIPDPLYGFRVIQNGIDVILWSVVFNPAGGLYTNFSANYFFAHLFIESVGGSTANPSADVSIPLTFNMCGISKTLTIVIQS